MKKYEVEIEDDLIEFFRRYIDDTTEAEILIVRMLKLLSVLIKTANNL